MADRDKLDKALRKCTEANPDSLWKCNSILKKYPKKAPPDTSKVTGTIGVKGPNYGKTKAKFKRQPPKED